MSGHKNKNNNSSRDYFDDEEINLDTIKFSESQDRQYNAMLPKQKAKLNTLSYFKNSHKYAGEVKYSNSQPEEHHKQDNDHEESGHEQEGESESEHQTDGIKQALVDIKKKRKERSNLLSENLKAIDREDKKAQSQMKENQKQEGNPEALENQLAEFNKLIEVRYYAQKNIDELKRYPTNNYPVSQSLHALHKQSERAAMSNLEKLVINFEKLACDYLKVEKAPMDFATVVKNIEGTNKKSKRINVEALWQKFEEQTKDITEKMEQQIVSWSQRTTLLRNSTNKAQYNSLLMQTPVGQAKKAIADWEKVSKKCHLKREPFKILFQPEENLREMSDKNIYDDLQLLQEVQRNYEQELQNQDKDFIIGNTMKFLQSKNRTKTTKQVDRKASKNRKLRYNVHPKLLNFMPCRNQNMLEAREQIVKNLFNKGSTAQAGTDYIDI